MDKARYRALTLWAFFLFVVIDLGFRWFGFDRVYSWTTRSSRRRRQAMTPERILEVFRAVQNATRFYYRQQMDCLPKALTTFFLLARQGAPANLCLGVSKFPFEGHAWVECQDLVLDDFPQRIPRYTVLRRLSPELAS